MEDLFLTYCEHKILHQYKKRLESRYKVKINMPDLQLPDLCATSETICVQIIGNSQNISFVQKFINYRLESKNAKDKLENDQSVIILNSDSENESDEGIVLSENKTYKPKSKKRRLDVSEINLVPIDVNTENHAPTCEVTSTTEAEESVILLDNPDEEFIPICNIKPKKVKSSSKPTLQDDNDIVVISSDEEDNVDSVKPSQIVPYSIVRHPKPLLRPVVIDGSNVARSHGKPQNTFSCKGIKICVDYFVKRGHPQVTAFVPLFRRHCKNGPVLTTDQHILEELEKTQQVVFTPSRRVDGRFYTCYDDRFIVELASSNGGVILSNDNYKDLIDESPAFAETIKNRLLMYCFVGDMLMIPADPLGVKGPKLKQYLSFPPGCDKIS